MSMKYQVSMVYHNRTVYLHSPPLIILHIQVVGASPGHEWNVTYRGKYRSV